MTEPAITYAATAEPCEVCGDPTRVRVGGRPGWWGCIAPVLEEEAEIAALEVGDARLLDALMLPEYAPSRWGKEPFWRPKQPEILDIVHVGAARSWSRELPAGQRTVTLDKSGAWISSAASADVAHGALEQTGPGGYRGPGFYKVRGYPWREECLPSPLGADMTSGEYWICGDRFKLLCDLNRAERWPDAVALDSYTAEHKARLDKWARHVNKLRGIALRNHGPESRQYIAVKAGFSQAFALMQGSREAGQARTWAKSPCRRADWSYAAQDLSACTLWRLADRLVTRGILPVAIRNTDELVITVEDFGEATERLYNDKPTIAIDPTGITLGTFKIKEDGE